MVGDWQHARYQTIIHGDPKAPNFFFHQQQPQSDRVMRPSDQAKVDTRPRNNVGVIDMQWSGLGLGAVDVAYCIAASADKSIFAADAGAAGSNALAVVQRYVCEYHSSLLAAFVKHGAAADAAAAAALLPIHVFQEQFEWAWIDLARIVIGDHWSRLTRDAMAAREGQMSYNAYNKSLEVGWVVVELVDEYLRRREAAAS